MTSMLSFAWRRRDKQQHSTTAVAASAARQRVGDDQSQFTSSPVPDVTTSASGETHLSSSSSSSQHHHVGLDRDEQSTTITRHQHGIDRLPTTPRTPEGLRPRKSPNQIRLELGLPAHVLLDRVHWLPPSFPLTTTMTTASTTIATAEEWQHDLGTSTSNNNLTSAAQSSPQISNASFYSRSSTYSQNRIAESPNLQVGHAKTAVGALIAMGQGPCQPHHNQQQHSIRQSSIPLTTMPNSITQDMFSGMDVLPPRAWIQDDEQLQIDDNDDDEDSTSSNMELPYQALHETTPIRRQRELPVQQSQTPESSSTMTTATSSNHASPSSNYNWRRSTRDRDNKGVNVSFSSQIGLIPDRQATTTQPSSYNFDSILAEHHHNHHRDHEVTGLVVESDHATNVSAMSQSTSAKDGQDRCELLPLSSRASSQEQQQYEGNSYEQMDNFYYPYTSSGGGGGEDVMERALRKRKNRNNRQAKEQLLLALVERLQDDHQLVADLQASHSNSYNSSGNNNNKAADHMLDWLVDWNGEGILTGLDPSKRSAVIRQLDSILNEMSVAQPEDFFMSPSQIQGYAQTHNNLHQALVFVRTLVLGAVSEMEKENAGSVFAWYQGRRWKCRPGFRSALGIDEVPQSPESVRGGDTSVFSLPSDDNTPHTSNVSLTTTITSYASSPIRARNGFTNIRPTMETVSMLLLQLSRACLDLMDSSKTIRATDQLKRAYLKLVAMQTAEIRALLDVFELEYVPPHKITRQVSEDDEAACHERRLPLTTTHQQQQGVRRSFASTFAPPIVRRSTILPPMPLMAPPPPSSESSVGRREPQVTPSKPLENTNHVNNNNNSIMSLPRTEDMTSLPSTTSNISQNLNTITTTEGVVWLVPPDGKDDVDDHYSDSNDSDDDEPEDPYDYVDDLRRQVGSTDYDDVDGGDQLREGPEDCDCFVMDRGDDEARCAAAV